LNIFITVNGIVRFNELTNT